MEPFIYSVDIADINLLYGRKKQIDTLISCAKRRGNAGIIGSRRFGKTCLLKSMESYLNCHPEIQAYPIFFDVKTQTGSHKNTSEVYRNLAAKLAAKMCSDHIIDEGTLKISRRCSLDISTEQLDMCIQMSKWDSEYQKNTLFSLADIVSKKDKYVLLLLDEIDYLLLEAFESPSDFFRIRGAATDSSNNLKFWVAGIAPWKEMCTDIGSPQLNCGLESITLDPLSKEDFSTMWEHECSLVKNENMQKVLLSLEDSAFNKTGGVPYYAKAIGAHILNTHTTAAPTYQFLRDHLSQLVNNRFMPDNEKGALFTLCDGAETFDVLPDSISGLMAKGLVRKDGISYSIGIGYLADYIKACKEDENAEDTDDNEQQELNSLVDEIIRLRIDVNQRYKDNEPFTASVEDPREFNVLKILCQNEADIDAFSGSVYKLYYEGSNMGSLLPVGFQYGEFDNMVRALRHMFNHRNYEPVKGAMSNETLLRIINNGVEPYKNKDFKHIQKVVLNGFHSELLKMLSQQHQELSSEPLIEKFVSKSAGIYMSKGNKVQDNRTRYTCKVESSQDKDFYDGAEVEYELYYRNYTKRKGSNGKFYFAKNVRFKE